MSAKEYNLWISENYDYRFGKDKPISLSNATTFDGQFINGEDFISSSRCAKCHTDTHPPWRESAHSNAFREPFYQKNVDDLIKQRNIAFTRHCESCHNRAALFSGALTDKPQFKNRPFDEEGVSCIACHSIESVNGRGVGGYLKNYYRQILAIYAEDVGSHYNLMIIFQKLGMREEARKEAAIFKDSKDDAQVTSLASNFLQANWSIGNESLPFHTRFNAVSTQFAEGGIFSPFTVTHTL